MNAKRYVEEWWQIFERVAVPQDTSAHTREVLRMTFFSGASAVFRGIITLTSDNEEITADDLAMMDALHEELEAFKAEHRARASRGVSS